MLIHEKFQLDRSTGSDLAASLARVAYVKGMKR